MAGQLGHTERTAPARTLQVIWAGQAIRDLQAISTYIRTDNPAAARSVATAIRAAANNLADFPKKGRAGDAGTREWVVPGLRRYLLIYDLDEAAGLVSILRVWHQSRNR